MSIYEILPALDLTQSVHAKISIGMHRVVKFKISRIPLIGLETRLRWRTDRKFLRNLNLNEINVFVLHVFWRPPSSLVLLTYNCFVKVECLQQSFIFCLHNRIGGVMVSMVAYSVVVCGFDSRSSKTED
jgi:hypothetical protein